MRGHYGKREFYEMFVFPVLARESLEERGTWMEENELVSRSMEGWEEGFVVFKYTAEGAVQ